MIPERPVLRYFGGKWVLAPWIIQHLPPHKIYIEPFGGAASVLLRKPRVYHEIYNDLNDEVVNVFRVLRNRTTALELERALRLTPFARAEYDLAFERSDEPVESARRMIMKAFMGFGGNAASDNSQTGFRSISKTTKRGTTPPSEWVTYADCIAAFCDRLSGVAIENRDALKLIDLNDSPETLFFLDPPYVHETRGMKQGYSFEMNNEAHEALIDRLSSLQGMAVLSGYHSDIYERLGWHYVEKPTFADGAKERTEVLWLNETAVEAANKMSLFERN